MKLDKYSIGIGDRFCRQGDAQLAAVLKGRSRGVKITPVWNKSNREHGIVKTAPGDTRTEADAAVKKADYKGPYFVDADHINLASVDPFIEPSDFFTLDVADYIGQSADKADIDAFVEKYGQYVDTLTIPGINEILDITEERLRAIGEKYLLAVREAGKIYRHIKAAKGAGNFITEVSMDETDQPQTPVELFFILAAIADESIPARTIAPKFTGRFNKGVDYRGEMAKFKREFEEDIAVIAYAVEKFGLPADLKLSVHSGSDKFSIYLPMRRAIEKFDAGLHLKTAGTTWLEEITGLAMAGGAGLELAKEIYIKALERSDELCGPYATVIDIHEDRLASGETVKSWDGARFAATLRHDAMCEQYNPSFRQLLHVAYKVAAEMDRRFYDALDEFSDVIGPQVTNNLFDKHIKPLFLAF